MAEKRIWDQNRREILSKVLPLDTPITLNIEASRACNIKCIYCIHSLSSEKLETKNFRPELMLFSDYCKLVDDCKVFKNKIKTIRFAGYGEPLVNKNLPDMIAYTKEQDICKNISIFTNAILLTEDLSQKLIESGINVIRIAIQGLNAEEYYKNCGARIDFKNLFSNVEYLYRIRKNCRIFIKILNFAIQNREEDFYRMFNDICDEIAIENVTAAYDEVDYSNIIDKRNNSEIMTRERKVSRINVCPYPFYMLIINADGNVSACCKGIDEVFFVGNIKNVSIYDMWNGEKINALRRLLLRKTRFSHSICKNCINVDYAVPTSDLLDEHAKRLLKYY